MDKNAPSFGEWYKSPDNPLQQSSDSVLHFSKEAMAEAFHAGMAYEKRLRYEREHPPAFTFRSTASEKSDLPPVD
jgi:hypothetical protein